MTQQIEGSGITLNLLETNVQPKPFVVSIYFDGNFWDYREFYTKAEAEAFMADPMREDRPKPKPEPELDRSYLDTVEGPWKRLR